MGRIRVKIEWSNEELRRLALEANFQPKRWGRELVISYRKKIQILQSARDERDLRAMRSLKLEKLKGDRTGQHSIRLNDQFRIILTFRTEEDGRVIVILDLVDYH